jgi:Domain of unknown function (DUF1788)
MTDSLLTSLDTAIAQLKRDLEGGAQISTMRNYRFAILVYNPRQEFDLRQKIQTLSDELRNKDWNVLSISLHYLFLKRVQQLPPRERDSIARMEHRQYDKGDPTRALNYLKDKLSLLIEGKDGIAADVIAVIADFTQKYPIESDRSLIFLSRLGSLYPFLRSSSLLKQLDGKTQNLPVVLLYPGSRKDQQSLSFMDELDADRDYRPRIYA